MSSPWFNAIPPEAVSERFVRSSGPGGQNVNKVATAVQLRVRLAETRLPAGLKARLSQQNSHRMTAAGELLIQADKHRTQGRNRAEAWQLLGVALDRAAVAPRKRVATTPTRAAKQKRQETKRRRGELKQSRRKPKVD
ncbi:MAG: alternative ribosome rescue aminoacyl-tRNA hydrolase ArfB [Pseudomonadota bacterium]